MFTQTPQLVHHLPVAHALFSGPIAVEVLPQPDYWSLAVPAPWDGFGLKFTIPVGFKTDFASIPRPLKSIMDVDGNSRLGALPHDALYTWGIISRAEADELLRVALIAYGVSAAAARVYWAGVRVGGWKPWDRYRAENAPTAASFASVSAYQAWRAAGSPFLEHKAS